MSATIQIPEKLLDILRQDSRICVLTGAGISAPSGVPVFRVSETESDPEEGFWGTGNPEHFFTPEAFQDDPKHSWDRYLALREKISRCEPNTAHNTLAAWERRYQNFTLITQNIDGLHEDAGSERIIRLHGSLWRVRCSGSCVGEWEERSTSLVQSPPRCQSCGEPLRPAVVWFGELLPSGALQRAFLALECDVFLAIGTSGVVEPASSFVNRAKAAGALTVEINHHETAVSSAFDIQLQGSADEVMERLQRHLTLS